MEVIVARITVEPNKKFTTQKEIKKYKEQLKKKIKKFLNFKKVDIDFNIIEND